MGHFSTAVYKEKGRYKYKLPKSIREYNELIDRKLAEIRVCDPAVGSGAFLVGMMSEIVKTRSVLARLTDPNEEPNIYDFKRDAIQDSLHGVDIDLGAVEIAKLRLWLSLIVDEDDYKHIKPLPNLDYKIMQGNSLLEEYEGIPLIDERFFEKHEEKELAQKRFKEQQDKLSREYMNLHKDNNLTSAKKAELNKRLKEIENQLKALDKPKRNGQGELGFFGERETRSKANKLLELHERFFDAYHKSDKDRIHKQIDELTWDLIETTLKQKSKEDKLEDVKRFQRTNTSPFFLWQLNYAEIFREKGGFDVVIANPPYGVILTVLDKNILKQKYSHIVERIPNSFVYFLGLAYELAKPRGVVSFIIPNEFLFQIYMTKARKFFLENTRFLYAINVGEKVFEAIVPTCLIAFLKEPIKEYEIQIADFRDMSLGELGDHLMHRRFERSSSTAIKIGVNSAFAFNAKNSNLINKLLSQYQPLETYCDAIANGISTGCDEVYIIDAAYAKKLRLEKDFVKPCIVGGQFSRYFCPPITDTVVLYVTKEFQLQNHKHIAAYLKSHKKLLNDKSVEKRTGLRPYHVLFRARKKTLFDVPKLMIRQTGDSIVAALDENVGYFCIDSVNVARLKSDLRGSERTILAILNSKLLNFVYQELSQEGGRVLAQVKPQRLKILPIALPDSVARQEFAEVVVVVDKILTISRDDDYLENLTKQAKVHEYEKQIDELVYKLYDLTPEEIAIVEENK